MFTEVKDESKKTSLTAFCLNAETVFEAIVWVGAGDDLWVRAAQVHIPLTMDNVAAIALQTLNCKDEQRQINLFSPTWM